MVAPTAGLHFTDDVLQMLSNKNIERTEVTLHVGAGTFKPVKAEQIGGHEMHTELISVERETIEKMLASENKLIVVGTTSLRTIESLYYIGTKLLNGKLSSTDSIVVDQWEPYDDNNNQYTPKQALQAILDYMKQNNLRFDSLYSNNDAPGYQFKFVDALLTIFINRKVHCCCLCLLLWAQVGAIFTTCIMQNEFRFLSYGDSSLLWRQWKLKVKS